jgi:hypothetical protein
MTLNFLDFFFIRSKSDSYPGMVPPSQETDHELINKKTLITQKKILSLSSSRFPSLFPLTSHRLLLILQFFGISKF